jgi:hypothetical protein
MTGDGESTRPDSVAYWELDEEGKAEKLDSYTNWD